MHGVALGHVAVVGVHQVTLDHLDGVEGQRISVVAVGGGHIRLNGVGDGVHTGVGHQLLGHGLSQIGVHNGHVGSDLKVGDGILDALLIVGDNRERSHLSGGAGGGGNGAETGLLAQGGNAEHLAHLLKGDVGVLVFDPHGLGRVDGRASAHSHDPVGLELQHGVRALHDGFHRGIGLDTLEHLNLHAGFL